MVMRIAEPRKSECCPVIGQTEVESPFWDNITSPETEQTSRVVLKLESVCRTNAGSNSK
jgi:hypothetical protein